jgi:isochorismate synthase
LRLSVANRLPFRQGSVADPCGWLAAEISGSLAKIATIKSGRLVSLSLDLPMGIFDVAKNGRGDRAWLAPNADAYFFGGGSVVGFEDIGADHWQAECRQWVHLGDQNAAPLAFLTAPPAPQGGPPKICLPEVLLRRSANRQSIILSAFRDSMPVAAIARGWMTQFQSMIAPADDGECGIEKKSSLPDLFEWRERVRAATEAIGAARLDKVVLARKLVVLLRREIDVDCSTRKLAQNCPDCRIIKLPHAAGHVLAASPELLAVKRGAQIFSHAVAGTTARSVSPEADLRAVENLFASPKERREHALVVGFIATALREICDDVRHASEPQLMRLSRLHHLWTPVSGRLRQGFGLLEAIVRLHPTPAVLGFPIISAQDWLFATEERRDALYTGVAGWIDSDGDGEAAVVLRSAYVEGREAQLWAGAGIMAESDPDAEWAETELKMATMLELLEGNAS